MYKIRDCLISLPRYGVGRMAERKRVLELLIWKKIMYGASFYKKRLSEMIAKE